MGPVLDLMRRRSTLIIGAAFLVVAILVFAGAWFWFASNAPASNSTPPLSFEVTNATDDLGVTFAEGAPQAFGWNGTTALVTGVVGNPGILTVPSPLLGTFGGVAPGIVPTNRSSELSEFFHGGDTLGLAWNGSTWLISGEASWGDVSSGAAVYLSKGVWSNLTPILAPYFYGTGGIWFDGWNGSAWLLGGNSSDGASLVALSGSTVRDLTYLIPNNHAGNWIQFVGWNGTAWLVGGGGVFGAVRGGTYLDLLPDSPFATGGMFGADWNGTDWLVSGTPTQLETLHGSTQIPGPSLSSSFRWWVSGVAWDGHGWYIGGNGGSTSSVRWQPELEYLDAATGVLIDLTSNLPSAFDGGQVQFVAAAPWYGSGAVLMVGQGGLVSYSEGGGPSHGAAAFALRG